MWVWNPFSVIRNFKSDYKLPKSQRKLIYWPHRTWRDQQLNKDRLLTPQREREAEEATGNLTWVGRKFLRSKLILHIEKVETELQTMIFYQGRSRRKDIRVPLGEIKNRLTKNLSKIRKLRQQCSGILWHQAGSYDNSVAVRNSIEQMQEYCKCNNDCPQTLFNCTFGGTLKGVTRSLLMIRAVLDYPTNATRILVRLVRGRSIIMIVIGAHWLSNSMEVCRRKFCHSILTRYEITIELFRHTLKLIHKIDCRAQFHHAN